jgi:hypothetical protein
MHRAILSAALLILLLAAGCASKERLTAKATECRVTEVDILESEFRRSGSTTAWCAKCRGKVYQCATSANRDQARCVQAHEGSACF